MRNFFKVVSASSVTAGLVLTMSVWYFIFRKWGSFEGFWEPFNLKTFRVFYIILCLNALLLSLSSVSRYAEKGLIRVLLPAAFVFVLLSGGYVYTRHFDGTLAIGEGENYVAGPIQYKYLSMGPAAAIPALDFMVRVVEPEKREGVAEILKDGKIIVFGKEGMMIDRYRIDMPKTGPSLLFHLFIKKENSVEQSYMKLDLDPPYGEDSFMFFMLPYEFYVRKAEADGAFALDVRRGKFSLYEGIISPSEKIEVEGLVLTLVNARKYAVLRISRYPGLTVFFFSTALFLVMGGIGALMQFRRTGAEKRN